MSFIDISFRSVTTSLRRLDQAKETSQYAQNTLAATYAIMHEIPVAIPFITPRVNEIRDMVGVAQLRVQWWMQRTNRRLYVKRRLVVKMLARRGRFAILSYELVQRMVLLAYPDVVGN